MGFHWLSRPLIRSVFGVVGNFLCVFSCLIIISNVWKTQTHILRWSSWGWMLTEFRTIWFKNASRNLELWNPRKCTNKVWEFIQPKFLLQEIRFSFLPRFFTHSVFVLTFLYLYHVLRSRIPSQNDMSDPNIGDSRSESAHPKIKIGQKFVRS